MLGSMAQSAKKSLSLQKDMVFRLLVAMMVLMGWLCGIGTAVVMSLENLYEDWRLQQENQVSVYLLADSPEESVKKLEESLLTMRSVEQIRRVPVKDVQGLMTDYFADGDLLPTPVVLDVEVKPSLDRELFDAKVYAVFVDAQIDDAREMLSSISEIVRFSQLVMTVFAGIMLLIMVMLVSLTVRAGLRGKKQSLAVLQYVGATDGFIARLIVRQVFWQSIIGWVVAVMLILAACQGAVSMNPKFANFVTQDVFIAAAVSPLFLTVVATFSAWGSIRKIIQRSRRGA